MRGITRLHDTAETSRNAAASSARWFVGISRHGIVAAERMAHTTTRTTGFRRTLSLLAASTLIGLGVSLFVHARLGVPAYDVMLTAIRDRLGVSLGQAGWIFTGTLFVVAAALGHPPKPSSLGYIFANGVAVDAFMAAIRDPQSLAVRLVFVVLGTVAIAAAVALVVHSGLSGGSLELLSRAGEDRGHDPFTMRRNIEVSIVIGGFALGGDLGPATFFAVLTMSPLLRVSHQALDDHRAGRSQRVTTPSSRF